MEYFLVKDSTIVMGPVKLPSQWVDDFGVVQNLTIASPSELIAFGWLHMTPSPTVIRDPYDKIDTKSYTIDNDVVLESITLKPLELTKVISKKIQLTSSHRDVLLEGTFVFNGDVWWGDAESRQNVTGLTSAVANGVPLPANFVWRNSTRTPIPMDGPGMVALGATMLDWMNTIYGVYYYHAGNIGALTDIETVIAYDHMVAWPAATI